MYLPTLSQVKTRFSYLADNQLPLLVALLLEASIRHFSLDGQTGAG